MFGFNVEKATKDDAGKVTGNISLKLGDKEEVIAVNIAIDKLPATTYTVTIDGDAKVTDDYTVDNADLDKVTEGTTLTITAVKNIIVNGKTPLNAGAKTTITINADTTIIINTAE